MLASSGYIGVTDIYAKLASSKSQSGGLRARLIGPNRETPAGRRSLNMRRANLLRRKQRRFAALLALGRKAGARTRYRQANTTAMGKVSRGA
jgi:hypothetical protein